jgi:hypothetical protein
MLLATPPVPELDRCAPSKARRFLLCESHNVLRPSQSELPSVAVMFANSLNHAEKSRDTNNLKEAPQCGSQT